MISRRRTDLPVPGGRGGVSVLVSVGEGWKKEGGDEGWEAREAREGVEMKGQGRRKDVERVSLPASICAQRRSRRVTTADEEGTGMKGRA